MICPMKISTKSCLANVNLFWRLISLVCSGREHARCVPGGNLPSLEIFMPVEAMAVFQRELFHPALVWSCFSKASGSPGLNHGTAHFREVCGFNIWHIWHIQLGWQELQVLLPSTAAQVQDGWILRKRSWRGYDRWGLWPHAPLYNWPYAPSRRGLTRLWRWRNGYRLARSTRRAQEHILHIYHILHTSAFGV